VVLHRPVEPASTIETTGTCSRRELSRVSPVFGCGTHLRFFSAAIAYCPPTGTRLPVEGASPEHDNPQCSAGRSFNTIIISAKAQRGNLEYACPTARYPDGATRVQSRCFGTGVSGRLAGRRRLQLCSCRRALPEMRNMVLRCPCRGRALASLRARAKRSSSRGLTRVECPCASVACI